MTLVVAVTGPESIWLLADRRLSAKGRPPKDDARKVMFLETTDGVAILGYAGLGATARGTEPADWMSAVLRGRNLPLEPSLGALADAMKRQFPRHMVRMAGGNGPAHSVVVPAFLGDKPMLYTIDLVFARDRKSYRFRYTHHINDKPPRTVRLGLGGSGGQYLTRDTRWIRSLLRLVKVHDRSRVSPQAVADHLANLNNEVHLNVNSVGPRCIVAWRYRKGSVLKAGGGHQFYNGKIRDAGSPMLPTIGRGTDIAALAAVFMSGWTRMFEERLAGQPAKEPDKDEVNAELARLPDKPDEDLR